MSATDRVGFLGAKVAETFLSGFFMDPIEPGERVLVWTLSADGRTKRSIWCRTVEEAARAASHQGCHVYFSPAIYHDGLGPHQKGGAADVIGITALFADIDFAHADKAKPYPPDLDAALSILKAAPHYPSTIWHTGGGIQAAWFLQETEWLADDDRPRVAGIVAGWIELLERHAKAIGRWCLDHVGNLDRVSRLPGSMNVKPIYGAPRPVTVLEFDENRRFLLEDFEQFVDIAPVEPEDPEEQPGGIVLTRNPQPPMQMCAVLWDLDPKFRATWSMRRRDLRDQSFSSYDMALANIAVRSGFTDQQTADLIVKFRMDKGTPKDVKKAFRLDYIRRTVRKARKDMEATINAQ